MIHRVSSLLRLPPLLALALIGLMPVPAAMSQTPAPQVTTFDPSDVYFQGYLSVRDAEKFEQTSDFVEADDKLQRARKMFSSIQTYFPDWKADMVKGRMEKTEEAIAALTALAQDQEASDSLRGRVGQVITALGGTPPESATGNG